jgi:protein-S-isoprenylcysteine O-methyltransferase Ste14
VRNPIFTGVVVMAVGLTALEPSAVALGGLALVVAAIEAQVRWIEEPHLRAVHGAAYAAYAARTGRFAPGLGRVATSPS